MLEAEILSVSFKYFLLSGSGGGIRGVEFRKLGYFLIENVNMFHVCYMGFVQYLIVVYVDVCGGSGCWCC